MSCTSAIQASLQWCQGTPNYPGIRRRLYYIDKTKIVEWPTLTESASGQVTSATYTGNFTLAQAAVWNYIDVLPDQSQVTSESQGELPSITQLNKLTAVHPGTGEEATLAASYINNISCVFIIQDIAGNYRVIGNERWEATGKVSQDLGQGATGSARTTIEVEVTDILPAPFYTGEIVTADGPINEVE